MDEAVCPRPIMFRLRLRNSLAAVIFLERYGQSKSFKSPRSSHPDR
jgi:hypothetical protein